MTNKKKAYTTYLLYMGASAFVFSLIFTASQLYRINEVKLNPLELVLVGTVLELTCFIFEIPTGIIADLKSRKLSIVIGLLIMGIGFILEGSIPLFLFILVSQFLWGLGYTFTSGADDAWIADELENEGLENVYIRGSQVSQIFSLIGILVSMAIGFLMVNLPIIIGGLLFLSLSLILWMYMPEFHFNKASNDDRSTYHQMMHTFTSGLKSMKKKAILIIMVFISLMYGLYSEGLDRLWEAHILDIGLPRYFESHPILWFGMINIIATLISIICAQYIKIHYEKTGKLEKAWILIVLNLLMVISIILFGLAGHYLMAMFMYLTFYMMRTINGPIYRLFMNQNVESKLRATILSTYGQIDAFGQFIGGPFLGLIAKEVSISIAIIVSGIILSPTVILFILSIKHEYETKEVET